MAVSGPAAIGVAIDQFPVEQRYGGNLWLRALRIAFRKPLGFISLLIIVVLAALAVGAPMVERYNPVQPFNRPNPDFNPNSTDFLSNERDATIPDHQSAPSAKHWFGTDEGSRDTWARVVWGARRSLGIGVASLMIALATGSALGIVSGYFGGAFDMLMQRLLDALQSFPPLLILILAGTTFELSVRNLVLVLGFVGITQVSRLVRGSVLAMRELPFIEAARVLGSTDIRIMLRHILPNTLPTLIVVFTIGLPVVILAEAALSFLALAPPAPKGSWGDMLADGTNAIITSPWQALFSGGAITVSVLAFNLAGDALRDVLDPRLRV